MSRERHAQMESKSYYGMIDVPGFDDQLTASRPAA